MRQRNAYPLAVLCVGAGAIVLFIGASVIAALGRSVPTQLWTSASALVGALVGILIPSPRGKGSLSASAAASGVQAAAEQAADAAAAGEVSDAKAAQTTAAGRLQAAKGAQGAAQAQVAAAHHPDAAPQPGEPVAAQAAEDAATAAAAAVAAAQHAVKTAQSREQAVETALATVKGTRDGVVQAAGGLSHPDARTLADMGASTAVAAHQRLAAEAGPVGDPATRTPRQAQAVVYQAAAQAADRVQGTVAAAAQGLGTGGKSGVWRDPKLVVPFIVFVVALGLGVWFASGDGFSTCSTITKNGPSTIITKALCDAATIKQTANPLIALAAAAGGVLIGVFATPPASTASGTTAAA